MGFKFRRCRDGTETLMRSQLTPSNLAKRKPATKWIPKTNQYTCSSCHSSESDCLGCSLKLMADFMINRAKIFLRKCVWFSRFARIGLAVWFSQVLCHDFPEFYGSDYSHGIITWIKSSDPFSKENAHFAKVSLSISVSKFNNNNADADTFRIRDRHDGLFIEACKSFYGSHLVVSTW